MGEVGLLEVQGLCDLCALCVAYLPVVDPGRDNGEDARAVERGGFFGGVVPDAVADHDEANNHAQKRTDDEERVEDEVAGEEHGYAETAVDQAPEDGTGVAPLTIRPEGAADDVEPLQQEIDRQHDLNDPPRLGWPCHDGDPGSDGDERGGESVGRMVCLVTGEVRPQIAGAEEDQSHAEAIAKHRGRSRGKQQEQHSQPNDDGALDRCRVQPGWVTLGGRWARRRGVGHVRW